MVYVHSQSHKHQQWLVQFHRTNQPGARNTIPTKLMLGSDITCTFLLSATTEQIYSPVKTHITATHLSLNIVLDT